MYFGASEGRKKIYPGNGKTALALEGIIDHTAFSLGNRELKRYTGISTKDSKANS